MNSLDKQKQEDYKAITWIWHLFRDYGDITNLPKDEQRWDDIVRSADKFGLEHQEARKLIAGALMALEYRAKKNGAREVAA